MYLRSSLTLLTLLVALTSSIIFWPLASLPTHSDFLTYHSFEEAVADISSFDTTEASLLDQRCTSRAYHHEAPTDKVVVLLHGYTNCPQQFDALGQQLHAAGYNVLIPRMPGHGHADNLTEALGAVTHTDYTSHLHRAVAMAAPMGEEVVLMGLSVGGSLTMWASLYEERAHRFITIAPVSYPSSIPPLLRNAVVRYAHFTPNRFAWWDKESKNHRIAPPYAYNRYATKSLSAAMHMSAHIEKALTQGQGTGKSITFVINEHDQAISTPKLHDLAQHYRQHGMDAHTSIFPAALQLPHDIIDPHNIGDQEATVYAALIALVAGN